MKSKLNAKYAVKISDGVQAENILLDQSKIIELKEEAGKEREYPTL